MTPRWRRFGRLAWLGVPWLLAVVVLWFVVQLGRSLDWARVWQVLASQSHAGGGSSQLVLPQDWPLASIGLRGLGVMEAVFIAVLASKLPRAELLGALLAANSAVTSCCPTSSRSSEVCRRAPGRFYHCRQ
jgi:hypothetical protein